MTAAPVHLGRRMGLPLVLSLGMAASTMSLAIFSVLSPFLVADLGISRAELGWMLTGNNLGAALLSPAGGRLADRWGGRVSAAVLFTVATLAAVAISVAPAFAWMIPGVVLGGVANALGNPTTNKVISVTYPPRGRGWVTGVKQSGVQLGNFVLGAALPVTALALGWRGAVAMAAVIPVLGGLGALALISPRQETTATAPSGRYRASPAIRRLALYAFFMGTAGGTLRFAPLYAQEALGMSVVAAGAVASVLGGIGVVARIGLGRAAERSSDSRRWMAGLGIGAAVALVAVALGASAGSLVFWLGIVVAGATAEAWNAVVMLGVLSEVDEAQTGRASGKVLRGFLGGYAISPVAFGASIDVTGSYLWGWAAAAAMFLTAAVVVSRRRPQPAFL